MTEISSLCRTCLCDTNFDVEDQLESFNIFETDTLAEKLKWCSNIEMYPGDGYPSLVCETCYVTITDFFEFQQMCRSSLETLKKILGDRAIVESGNGENEATRSQSKNVEYIYKGISEYHTEFKSENSEDPLAVGSDYEEYDIESVTNSPSNREILVKQTTETESKQKDGPTSSKRHDGKSNVVNDALEGMYRESLEKFSLGKKTQKRSSVPIILVDNANASVVVSKDHMANAAGIQSEPEDEVSDHEMIVGDHSIDNLEDTKDNIIKIKSGYDSNEAVNDPLTGTKDCVILEAIRIARNEIKEKQLYCDHDYSQPCDAVVVRSKTGSVDKCDDRGLEYNNKLQIMCSAGESFSEINDAASAMHFNNTVATNIANLSMENSLSDTISIEDDKEQLFGEFSVKCEDYKEHLENFGFENEVDCILMDHDEDKDANTTQLYDRNDRKNEDAYVSEGIIEGDRTCFRMAHVSEETDEDYLRDDSPSEDKEIYSDSGSLQSDSKPKTANKFSCDLCPQNFILEQRLIAHKRNHQGLAGYPCSRENCTRSFQRITDLRQHIDDHDGIPRRIYKCDFDTCGLKYTNKSGLMRHLAKCHNYGAALPVRKHVYVRKYVCEICGAIFKYNNSLKIHQYLHVDESLWPFKCDIEGCSKRFRSENFYKIHKNRHNGIKLYACTYCDKRFCSNPNLQVHINFHTLEKKWLCSFCPKVAYTPANLKLHIREKHGMGESPIVCEECGRGFARPCDLRHHAQSHMPRGTARKKARKTVKNFYCHVCNHAFATSQNLKSHEVKHTGEKPFECDICGVKFRYNRNLYRHRKQKLCRKSKTMKEKCPPEEESIQVPIIDEKAQIILEDTQ